MICILSSRVIIPTKMHKLRPVKEIGQAQTVG